MSSGVRSGLAVVAVLAVVGTTAHVRQRDPDGAWLWQSADAGWIREDVPLAPPHHRIGETTVLFRVRFELAEPPADAVLTLAALRRHRLLVNGAPLGGDPPARWNERRRVPIAQALVRGANEIRVEVGNDRGPPVLLAHSRGLGVATGRDGPAFETSRDGQRWRPARAIADRTPFAITGAFPSAADSLRSVLPLIALLFAVGAAASFAPGVRAAHVRWLLLGAWTLLCARSLFRLAPGVGFDVVHHHAYVVYLHELGRIPLASDGWQMFQSPLFYLVATPFHALLSSFWSAPEVFRALRVLPMLCGLAQIEIAFRAARTVFPDGRRAQVAALVVGGLLPINLYSAQVFSNEPMAGAVSALLVWLAMRLLCGGGPASPLRAGALLGSLLGVAALVKVTPLLLAPALAGALVVAARRRGHDAPAIAGGLGAFAASAAALGGWYYLRNWVLLGRPFVGGWDPGRGFGWWQDPGYRSAADLTSFGASLSQPFYASLAGFWDGLHSTLWLDGFLSGVAHAAAVPWRTELLSAMSLLSLPMALALGAGTLLAARRGPARAALVFAAVCLVTYLGAMLWVYVSVPAYSSVKATYTLGLVPCYGVLVASTFERLERGPVSRALVSGYLAAWAGASWLGYLL